MRVIAKNTLQIFWDKYPNSKTGLLYWFTKISNKESTYKKPSDITDDFIGSDYVGNGRIVFNIAQNKYRLIVFFIYQTQICYIRFISTHTEYDRIQDIQHI